MINKSILYEYNPWWEGAYAPKGVISRPQLHEKLLSFLNNKQVVFVTGLRRVGKTTLMKMVIHSLLQQGTTPQHIFYISLDDFVLKELTIIDIVTEYRACHRIPHDQLVYVFLDEITYKQDYRHQLKNLYDKQATKVYVSSSSSSALRDQRGFLTGRENTIKIPPLNFDEFLHFRNIEIKKSDHHILKDHFEEYLQVGGMPEYVLNQEREYLTNLVEDILAKDIVAYHQIKNPQIIRDYFMLLMERAGKQISINKVANILDISPDTASRYLYLFQDTFLIYLVPRYGKTNETILSAKKIYAADLGIRHLFTGFRDKGGVFENYVFNLIKDKNPRYVYQDGMEIDFITEDKKLIEVKYESKMTINQQLLFDQFPAEKKLIINGFDDLTLLTQD